MDIRGGGHRLGVLGLDVVPDMAETERADALFSTDKQVDRRVLAQSPRTLYGRRRRVRPGAVVALLVGAGLVAWAIVGDRGTESTPTGGRATTAKTAKSVTPVGPVGLSAKGLADADGVGQPAGLLGGREAGLSVRATRTAAGKVFIRYLPQGVKVGSKQATFRRSSRRIRSRMRSRT